MMPASAAPARLSSAATCIPVALNLVHPADKGGSSLEELLDWESWKRDTPFWVHAVAGSCAGVVEHSLLYPLDTVKTRTQAMSARTVLSSNRAYYWRQNLRRPPIWREVYQQSGFRGFFSGFPAICVGSVAAAFCGALATLSHDFILTPSDVIKQRLQLGCYPGGIVQCVASILRHEGWGALYRSMPTTIVMNVPFGAVFVATNEALKRWLRANQDHPKSRGHASSSRPGVLDETQNDDDHPTVPPLSSSLHRSSLPGGIGSYFLCAGLAGGAAGLVTTPLDVVKTRLQTQDVLLRRTTVSLPSPSIAGRSMAFERVPKYRNFISTVREVRLEEGMRGFFKGGSARLALSIPSAAVCWGEHVVVVHDSRKHCCYDSGTYECVKLLLKRALHDDK